MNGWDVRPTLDRANANRRPSAPMGGSFVAGSPLPQALIQRRRQLTYELRLGKLVIAPPQVAPPSRSQKAMNSRSVPPCHRTPSRSPYSWDQTTSSMTRPPMSVSRLKRPAWRTDRRYWSRPMSLRIVAWMSRTGTSSPALRTEKSSVAPKVAPGSDAASGQPDHQPVLVVVAAGGLGHQVVVERRAAHLRGPDDERLVEQSAGLQVLEQAGDGLVDLAAMLGHASLDIVVVVPAITARAVEGHARSGHRAPPFDAPAGIDGRTARRPGRPDRRAAWSPSDSAERSTSSGA